ncbi:putative helicase C15C4.05 [Exophiala dermatitidis]
MAPNRKKKKPVANPARGFATTSLPSKAKVTEQSGETTAQENGDAADPAQATDAPSRGKDSSRPSDGAPDIKDMNPEELEAHLETSELEALVEKYAARSIADANRQAAKLETERRQLRSQAYRLSTYPWLSDEIVDHLLRLNAPATAYDAPAGGGGLVQDEEKLLVDLWTLERVLESLKLPRVGEAISHVAVLATLGRLDISSDSLPGLQEAFEWYASSTDRDELPNYEAVQGAKPNRSGDSTPIQPISEPTTAIQSRQSPASTPMNGSEPEEESSPEISSDSDEDNDPARLIGKYIRLQRLIWEAQKEAPRQNQKTSLRNQKRVSKLSQKVQELRRDPLFDEYEAEAAWSQIHVELQADHQYQLRERAMKRRAQKPEETQKPNDTDSEQAAPPREQEDVSVEEPETSVEADGLLGGMFEAADEGVSTDQNGSDKQDPVKLVDFGKWTGVSPRKLLDDICKGHDSRARISLRTLHQMSHSARHSLDISWTIDVLPGPHTTNALPAEVSAQTDPRLWKLEMVSMAAATSAQSEAYVCALGLFLVSSLGAKEQKATSRLPTVWRDLLKDLTDSKQKLIDEEHKQSLRRIRALIHETQEKIKANQEQLRSRNAERPQQSNALVDRRRTQRPKPARWDLETVSKEWEMRSSRPAFKSMLEVRRQLPVHHFRDMILSCVTDNPVSVICAETGAGKSSGIPVLLLEQEFNQGRDCRILVTQPRRISAVTLARRVSQELGEARNDLGTTRSLVGYAIRLESKTSNTTRITYATTGVLLRMLEESPELDELDFLILDEVHERSMDLDLLFIALKKLQKRRSTLKIVLMSATVDAKKFSDYFGGAPVLDLPGRTFPVQVGFLEDAVEATNDVKGDKALATIQDDDNQDEFFSGNEKGRPVVTNPEAYSSRTLQILSNMDEYRIDYNLIVKLAVAVATKPKLAKYSSAILIFMPGIGEMRRLHNLLVSVDTFSRDWVVYLLHSTFSTEDLEKAFERPPPGCRKIVIATNIAETGITIPDVTAVIDTCKEKVMRFDERRQLSRLTEGFISRSSARQRRGRAARVQEGLCYHLVTRHRHDNLMLEQQVPEMLRLGLQDPILRIKVWDLGSIEETLNAAIDPPSRKNILRAIEKLKDAGALTKTEALTPLGQQIARLPLEVSLAKLAIFGVIFKCLDPILAIVALLTSKSPFVSSSSSSGQADTRQTFSRGDSDLLSSYNAYEAWRRARVARSAHEFCRKNHISDQAMAQIEDQRIQLLVYLVDAGMVVLSGEEKAALNRARSSSSRAGSGSGSSSSFYTIPPRYQTQDPVVGVSDRALNSIIAMAVYPRILTREGKGWRNVYTNQQVSLTARSVNHPSNSPKPPRWLSFYEAMQNSRSGNLNVFETSAVPESALALLLGSDTEFKFYAGVLVLDSGKVKLAVRHWRQLVAIKVLRENIRCVLETCCYRRPGQEVPEDQRKWLDFWLSLEAAAAAAQE